MKRLRPILLAEDNPNDVELILTAFQGANLLNEIQVTRDGEEALDFLYRRGPYSGRTSPQPAVILLDLKMPKVDGREVLRQVRADPQFRHVPVVILTSSREEADLVASYQLGVNAFVVKPVDFQEFISAVGQLGFFWALLNEAPRVDSNPPA
ncbi:MAG: response regulator [Opitutaceae bacterium]|nr:response regulator [Opitutaceae bacterium]